jgi:hypothetical protein
MSQVVITITKEVESEILRQASGRVDEHIVEVTAKDGQKISIVGAKKGGVEGGAIVSLQNRTSAVLSDTSVVQGSAIETKYVAKVMYRDDNVKGKQYYVPNAKSKLRAWYGRKTRDEINISVMQEFAALRLARIINPEVVPDARLGRVEEKDGKGRFFLMTELAGQKEGETFQTLDKYFSGSEDHDAKISKEMWKFAFAISVGLLNDQDVNKGDNIGVVSDSTGNKRMCLFDLGHPTPDKFKLDPNTFLPKSTNLLADLLLWVINIFVSANNLPWTFTMVPDVEKQLSPEERKEALAAVLGKKGEILQELDSIIQELDNDPVSQQAIQDLKVSIENRMEYLQKLLHPVVS